MPPVNVRHELHLYSHNHVLVQTHATMELLHFFPDVPQFGRLRHVILHQNAVFVKTETGIG